MFLINWKIRKRSTEQVSGLSGFLSSTHCVPDEDPWLERKSQDVGDRALGHAEGQEPRLPTQAGSSVPLAITSSLGPRFPKVSPSDKMVSKVGKKLSSLPTLSE